LNDKDRDRADSSLKALQRALHTINSKLELAPTLEAIVREGYGVLGADRCAIYLIDLDTGALKSAYSDGISKEYLGLVAANYRALPGGRLLARPEPIFILDAQVDPAYEAIRPNILREGFRSIALLPLPYRSNPIGALVFYHNSIKEYSEEEKELAMNFATHVAIALGNAQLFDQVKSHKESLEKLNAELSEMKESLERKVKERTQQLEEANRIKTQLLSNASHELRTPLNSIIGFAEILLDPTIEKSPQDTKEFLTYIYQSGQKLLSLIKDLLDISRLESDRLEFYPEEFSITEFFEELKYTVLQQEENRKLDFRMVVDCTTDVVTADRVRLMQAIGNILSNAFKFTDEGGAVTVAVTNDEKYLQIVISDTGRGIPAKDREKIFEEFYQVDRSISRDYEGMGLGLALTRRFVDKMLGTVRVESAPGEGSVFTIHLPLRPPDKSGWV
jgi:signal transduction histidine kinase